MIEIEKLRSSKALRTAVLALCLATISFTGLSALYIRFHYAEVMPRSPQPETGRIYPMPAQYGGTVYVSRAELDRSDFVKYRLEPISGVVVLLCFSVGAWLGWWPKDRSPFAGGVARN